VRAHDDPDQRGPTQGDPERSNTTTMRSLIRQAALAEAGFSNPDMGTAKPEMWAHLLTSVPLFSSLGKRDLRRVAAASKITRVSAGQMIVREGFNAEAFYILLTGKATVQRPGAEDVGVSPGEFFGELGLLDGSPRIANVVAETDLWAVRLPRQDFLDLVDHQPSIARGLLQAMAGRLRRLEQSSRT
jgi:CRP-like cAMP-binding protein